MKDEYGTEIKAGDWITFSFGTPAVRVEARVIERSGKLVALTPTFTPKEATLTQLKYYVGYFRKISGPSAD